MLKPRICVRCQTINYVEADECIICGEMLEERDEESNDRRVS